MKEVSTEYNKEIRKCSMLSFSGHYHIIIMRKAHVVTLQIMIKLSPYIVKWIGCVKSRKSCNKFHLLCNINNSLSP